MSAKNGMAPIAGDGQSYREWLDGVKRETPETIDGALEEVARYFPFVDGPIGPRSSTGQSYLIISSGMLPYAESTFGVIASYPNPETAISEWYRAFKEYALPLYNSGRDMRLHWRTKPHLMEGNVRVGRKSETMYRVYARLVIVDHTRITA